MMVSWLVQLLEGKGNCLNAQENIAAACRIYTCRILSCCIEYVSSLFAFYFFNIYHLLRNLKGNQISLEEF